MELPAGWHPQRAWKWIALILVGAMVVAAPIAFASGRRHTVKQAQAVVVKEIKARYGIAYDPSIVGPSERVKDQASCSPLSSALFKCTWEAQNKDIESFGKAIVKFYAQGYLATFSDVTCSQNYSNKNANPVAAQIECDTNPHNS